MSRLAAFLAARRNPRAISRWELLVVGILAVVAVAVLPFANQQGWISDFAINLWGKYLCYALLAISVDLLWGYTGLLSLGQALFFSLGGYMIGMHLMRMIGDLGQYHKPIPDFLVFLGWTELPTFWKPFASFPFALLMVLLIPGLLSWIFGYLAFRSRIKGVYFSILTQALTYGAALMFFRNDLLMGGNNGFTDFKFVLGFDIREPATQRGLFVVTAATLLGVYLLCRWLNGTKFGLVQQAVRDGENRALFSGYATAHFKLFVFIVSALIAAIGGALYVPQVGIINPSEMTPDKSLEAVVWVAVGGRGTLLGPVIGAIGVNALKSWATRAIPDLWILLMGGLFIVVVLFLPGGVVSIPGKIRGWFKKKSSTPAASASAPTGPSASTAPAKS
jgi:urea transport system permease protein